MLTKISIIICDDHEMFRESLKTALQTCDDFEVIQEVSNGVDAVKACETLHPDVILTDIMLPQMDGLVAAYLIRAVSPNTRVLMLTGFREKILVWATMQSGAAGYLLKGLSIEELSSAIRDVYAGRLALSPEIAQALVESIQPPVDNYHLTPREKEVLGYIVRGMSNNAIALIMMVSPATAKKHVSNILAKLQVENRAEAVAVALHQKLLDVV